MINNTIGLFGTCGNSQWRDLFIEEYKKLNINYFNPQKENWKPEDAVIEAHHLANDDIILFPITNETYGLGSLSEVGFSILQAIKLNKNRFFVVLINLDVKGEDEKLREESIRMRALVREHLRKLDMSNVYVVTDMLQMLDVSLKLYDIQSKLGELNFYYQSRK
jgi:hypothetical protein